MAIKNTKELSLFTLFNYFLCSECYATTDIHYVYMTFKVTVSPILRFPIVSLQSRFQFNLHSLTCVKKPSANIFQLTRYVIYPEAMKYSSWIYPFILSHYVVLLECLCSVCVMLWMHMTLYVYCNFNKSSAHGF